MGSTLTYQFVAAFHTDRNLIEIPSIYHRQWAPHYPPKVLFAYNGSNYIIKVRKDDDKYFFADGLKEFRKALNIQEGITITYAATDRDWVFNLHFMPPLDNQTCGRPPATRRTHVWTVELIEAMISAPHPLVLPMHALSYRGVSRKNMMVLADYGYPLLWKLTVHDAKKGLRCVAKPWYQYLRHNDFSAGDEICFYFRPNQKVWELVIRKEVPWDETDSD